MNHDMRPDATAAAGSMTGGGSHGAHPGAHAGHATQAGHDRHAGHSVAMFRDRFWLSLLLTIPVVLLEPRRRRCGWATRPRPSRGSTCSRPPRDGRLPVRRPRLPPRRRRELRERQPGMMTLISLAIIVAFVHELGGTLGLFEVEIWWELATLITIMLLGHWLEMRSIAQARGALARWRTCCPIPPSGSPPTVPRSSRSPRSRVGDVVLVRPGGRVPADGTVVDGIADVDESMITGESRAVTKRARRRASSRARCRRVAPCASASTPSARRPPWPASCGSSPRPRLPRRAPRRSPTAPPRSCSTSRSRPAPSRSPAGGPLGDPEEALVRTATVLVIACPHALGLAIPLVIAISTSLGARNGLLVKDRLALERARELDVVIFDKTGTLTRGEPVSRRRAAGGTDEDEVLALAAAVEADSEHPLARAVVGAAGSGARWSRLPRGLRGACRARRPRDGRRAAHPRRRAAPPRGAAASFRTPRSTPRRRMGGRRPDRPLRHRRWPRRRRLGARGRGPARVARGGRPPPRDGRARRDDHRRRAGGRRRGRAPARHRRGRRRGPAGRQGRRRRAGSRPAAGGSRWSATA